jgi:hypothetical protein
MTPDASPPTNNQPTQGLPPVKPPSARFIVQLFLIPGLIVAGLVFVWVFGSLIVSGSNTPEAFLQKLDNPNPDIRWRAAHDLAQVLKRPESLELASDPDFALDIAERLKKAWRELEQAEDETKSDLASKFDRVKADKSLSKEEKAQRQDELALAAWTKLRPQRDLVTFYTSCVSDFTVPVGVNVLVLIAMKDESAEVKGLAQRRRQAVLALANLGKNLKTRYYGKDAPPDAKSLTEEQKRVLLEKLTKAAVGKSERAQMAHGALNILTGKEPSRVDKAMELCVQRDLLKLDEGDPFLRALIAFALTFWDGDRVEPTLLLLSRDSGRGRQIKDSELD